MESPRNETAVQPAAAVDRTANGVVIPIERATDPPDSTEYPTSESPFVYSTEKNSSILSEIPSTTQFYQESTTEQVTEASPSEDNVIPQVPGKTRILKDDGMFSIRNLVLLDVYWLLFYFCKIHLLNFQSQKLYLAR